MEHRKIRRIVVDINGLIKRQRSFDYENKVCRVCLAEGSIPIFGPNHGEQLVNAMQCICGVELTPTDHLPKYLCKTCRASLLIAALFRKKAQASDKFLKQNQPMSVQSEDPLSKSTISEDNTVSMHIKSANNNVENNVETIVCYTDHTEHIHGEENDVESISGTRVAKTCEVYIREETDPNSTSHSNDDTNAVSYFEEKNNSVTDQSYKEITNKNKTIICCCGNNKKTSTKCWTDGSDYEKRSSKTVSVVLDSDGIPKHHSQKLNKDDSRSETKARSDDTVNGDGAGDSLYDNSNEMILKWSDTDETMSECSLDESNNNHINSRNHDNIKSKSGLNATAVISFMPPKINKPHSVETPARIIEIPHTETKISNNTDKSVESIEQEIPLQVKTQASTETNEPNEFEHTQSTKSKYAHENSINTDEVRGKERKPGVFVVVNESSKVSTTAPKLLKVNDEDLPKLQKRLNEAKPTNKNNIFVLVNNSSEESTAEAKVIKISKGNLSKFQNKLSEIITPTKRLSISNPVPAKNQMLSETSPAVEDERKLNEEVSYNSVICGLAKNIQIFRTKPLSDSVNTIKETTRNMQAEAINEKVAGLNVQLASVEKRSAEEHLASFNDTEIESTDTPLAVSEDDPTSFSKEIESPNTPLASINDDSEETSSVDQPLETDQTVETNQTSAPTYDMFKHHTGEWRLKIKRFKCEECDSELNHTFKSFVIHNESEHPDKQKWKCTICSKFISISYFERHAYLHVIGEFMCEVCGKTCLGPNNYRLHKATHSTDLPIQCMQCSYRGRNKYALKYHMKSHLKENKFKSESTTRNMQAEAINEKVAGLNVPLTLEKRSAVEHPASFNDTEIESTETPLAASEDPTSFNKEIESPNTPLASIDDDNEETSSVDQPLHSDQTVETNQSPAPTYDMFKHHTGEWRLKIKRFKCEECDSELNHTFKSFVIHNESEHPDKQKWKCSICSKLISRSYFERHAYLHVIGEYMCEVCGKTSLGPNNYRLHKATHSTDLPSQCTLCSYRGRNKYALNSHMKSHVKENKFKCDTCSRTFKKVQNLRTHIRVHRDCAFECEPCNRKFRTKALLKRHKESIHLVIPKNHICKICDKSFTLARNLRSHELAVHKSRKMCSGNFLNKLYKQEI